VNLTGEGGFMAGVSGNPGGRPKAVEEVRDLARAHCPDAIAELARLAVRAKSECARIAVPDLPIITREVPGVDEVSVWLGLVAPRGTPAVIVPLPRRQ
jgi:hypothetical protein